MNKPMMKCNTMDTETNNLTEFSAALQVKDLTLAYDDKIISSNLSLDIPQGKISVILGANGCGKSTLLKALARLLKAKEGSIIIDGKDLASWPSKLLAQKLGLLPQSPVVPEGIRVADLVARGRYPYRKAFQGMSKEDYNKVQEALELMGVSSLAERCVDELSGGQRQRVWIALALAQNPNILLLDEPTTYLDISYQVDILDTLKEINLQKGTTIVMVLHDINLSTRYADHIFALKEGRLIAQGKPKDIIKAELMHELYELNCMIIDDPITLDPLVVPLSRNMSC